MVAIILSVHFILGLVYYVRFAYIHRQNKTLTATNKLLKEDNRRIYQLESTFSVLEESNERIRHALGIGLHDSSTTPIQNQQVVDVRPYSEVPAYLLDSSGNTQISEEKLSKLDDFLKEIKSPYHEYLRNIPTLLPVDGLVTSGFDDVSREGNVHQGVDIAAQRGSIIRSSGDGVVIISSWTYDLGNFIIIYHGNDIFTLYAHNQLNFKQRASIVRKGDPIATVGSTGQSSAPHLHFEIWKNGIPIDPKKLILSLVDTSRS